MFVKVLKSFVGIVGSPPPPACGSMVVKIGYTEEPNVVQSLSKSSSKKAARVLRSLNSRASPMLSLTGAVALPFVEVG